MIICTHFSILNGTAGFEIAIQTEVILLNGTKFQLKTTLHQHVFVKSIQINVAIYLSSQISISRYQIEVITVAMMLNDLVHPLDTFERS